MFSPPKDKIKGRERIFKLTKIGNKKHNEEITHNEEIQTIIRSYFKSSTPQN